MADEKWHDVGSVEDLRGRPVTPVRAGTTPIALVCREGVFTAISGVCNHVGGPLGEGRSTATTSSAPGTTGSSTARPARASRASRPTACRATP